MRNFNYPAFETREGYLTDTIRRKYIDKAVQDGLLPQNAHRMSDILSLDASNNPNQPIQFWQLYSVLGPNRIIEIVRQFYTRVFDDEPWFKEVFAKVGGIQHHINTQAAMWIDSMGGGRYYHGAEYRLHVHHLHNAHALMNDKGARRWVELMVDTLHSSDVDQFDDPRVRPALNTFLHFFMQKYSEDFNFQERYDFGEINKAYKKPINFLKLSEDEIRALPMSDLKEALVARGVDIGSMKNESELVNTALRL